MIINSSKLRDKNSFNENVLKNFEPKLNSILHTYGHTVLYKFDTFSQKWNLTEKNGPLFILECDDGYKIFLLNRKNPENFHLQVNNIKMKIQESFVFIKMKGEIYGLWFYDTKEGDHFLETIEKLKKIPLKTDFTFEELFNFKKNEIHTLRDLQIGLQKKIDDKEFLLKLFKKIKFEN